MNSKRRGFLAEGYAVKLLEAKGYKILERNFRTSFSEIDIITVKEDVLVFVEVKARWGTKHGKPEEAINQNKLLRIKKAGEEYYLKRNNLPKKLRIDVVSLIFDKEKIVTEKIIRVF